MFFSPSRKFLVLTRWFLSHLACVECPLHIIWSSSPHWLYYLSCPPFAWCIAWCNSQLTPLEPWWLLGQHVIRYLLCRCVRLLPCLLGTPFSLLERAHLHPLMFSQGTMLCRHSTSDDLQVFRLFVSSHRHCFTTYHSLLFPPMTWAGKEDFLLLVCWVHWGTQLPPSYFLLMGICWFCLMGPSCSQSIPIQSFLLGFSFTFGWLLLVTPTAFVQIY